jgi:hypothetical protein
MTYAMLLQILEEAEQRRDHPAWPADVRQRSAETVALCEERMQREGISRAQLVTLARA